MVAPAEKRGRVVWNYDDLVALPEGGARYEILDGELQVTPSPSTIHQSVSKRLQFELMLQLEKKNLGIVFGAPTDVILGDQRVLVPDLLVLSPNKRNLVSQRGIEGPPDLVVEILSPGTASVDRGPKRKLYAAAAVGEYWIVDPGRRHVEVLPLGEGEYGSSGDYGPGATANSVLFPFSILVDALFE